jgi:hypothetical protein
VFDERRRCANVKRTKELWSCDVLPFLFKKRNPCAKLFVLAREKFCWSETTSSSKCKDASHCVLLRGAVEGEEIISLSITQSSESKQRYAHGANVVFKKIMRTRQKKLIWRTRSREFGREFVFFFENFGLF